MAARDPDPDRFAMTHQAVELMRAVPLFADVADQELCEIAVLCDVAIAHPGQVVQAQDVPVRRWHLITAGHAVVQRDGVPLGLLARGDSWGEHSLLNQVRSPVTVVALSPVTLLTVRDKEFFSIPEAHPVLAGRLLARSAVSADRLALPVFNALTHASNRIR
jgi:signal-transduction protein with cAMP-binding, CBS, and nucleotidyltransferase domain